MTSAQVEERSQENCSPLLIYDLGLPFQVKFHGILDKGCGQYALLMVAPPAPSVVQRGGAGHWLLSLKSATKSQVEVDTVHDGRNPGSRVAS